MKRVIIAAIFTLSAIGVKAQINLPLKHELDSIYALDQKYRRLISAKPDSAKTDSLTKLYHVSKADLNDYLWKLQGVADSLGIIRVEAIIKQYGYPGKKLVGEPTNEAALFVLQHSDVIDQYLAVVKQAADKKGLPFRLYAMMRDRSLMYHKQPQVWGSQAKGLSVRNAATGKSAWKFFIWPMDNPQDVNKRRKAAGFEETIEVYAKRMGITYKAYTMDDVKNGRVN